MGRKTFDSIIEFLKKPLPNRNNIVISRTMESMEGVDVCRSIDEALEKRKAIDARYREGFAGVKGIHCLSGVGEKIANYAYFPILVRPEYLLNREELYQKMRDNGIYARRYFYPLISDFPMYRCLPSAAQSNLPVASKVASEVICLPIYPELSDEQVDSILELIVVWAG